MRFFAPLALFIAIAVALPFVEAQDDGPMKSELESNPKGWMALPTDMESWKRAPSVLKGKLAAKNPWSFDKDGVLSYEGGPPEMLLFGQAKPNGIFHAEWRFKKPPAATIATGGLVVRTALNGGKWHEAVAGSKAGGYFVGVTTINDKSVPVPANKKPGPSRIVPNDWNVYEVTFHQKSLSLFNNGYVTAHWFNCDVPNGYIGFRGDGHPIEFRNIKFKQLR